jgi:hypothetical protein
MKFRITEQAEVDADSLELFTEAIEGEDFAATLEDANGEIVAVILTDDGLKQIRRLLQLAEFDTDDKLTYEM